MRHGIRRDGIMAAAAVRASTSAHHSPRPVLGCRVKRASRRVTAAEPLQAWPLFQRARDVQPLSRRLMQALQPAKQPEWPPAAPAAETCHRLGRP